MSYNITIEGIKTVRLPTKGKYCDRDIVVSTEGVEADPILQEKTVTPATSSQSVTPDSGYDGLSKVTVNAMPTATQATPSITVSSAGVITASATQTAGYVTAGTKSATKQLTTQAAKTITPSTSSQTAVAAGRYTTGAVTVAAIPSTYVKPSATKAATTYTPSTADQTIATGTYCSGAQTIKGDANLRADNIAEGVSIFGVAGTHRGSEDLDAELTTQESLISQLSTILDGKANGGSGDGAVDITGCNPYRGLNLAQVKRVAIVSHDAESTNTSAFADCPGLTSVDFPVLKSIEAYAFFKCSALTSVNFPVATSVGMQAFGYCSALPSISLPSVNSVGEQSFEHCTSLASVDLPNATSIGKDAFVGCTALTTIVLPSATSIGEWAFEGCASLTTVDLPSVTSIGERAFYECTNLKALILRNENAVCEWTFVSILGTGIVTGEGVPTGTGFLYVPTKFYENYLEMATMQGAALLMMQGMGEAEAQATAEYLASLLIRKIEDYPEICG